MSPRLRKSLRVSAVTVAFVAAAVAVALPRFEASATPTPNSLQHISGSYNNLTSGKRFFSPPDGPLGGQFVLQSDYWNKAAVGTAIPFAPRGTPTCNPGGFDISWDPDAPVFTVSGNTANSYFPNGNDPGCGNNQYFKSGPNANDHQTCTQANFADAPDLPGCNWAGSGDPWLNPNLGGVRPDGSVGVEDPYATTGGIASWLPQPPDGRPLSDHITGPNTEFSNEINAPASYPSLFVGCHWGNCSPGTGAPFPMQLSGLAAMPVVWDFDTTHAAAGGPGAVFDASLDIWLDTNTRPFRGGGNPLPNHPDDLGGSPGDPGQNDGAEVMIWANNRGYSQNPRGNPITPTGRRLYMNVTLPGVDGLWDVWGGRARSFDNGIRWNVVSFVNVTTLISHGNDTFHTSIGTNSGPVVNGVQESGVDVKPFLNFATNLGAQCTLNLPAPAASETTNCVEPSWWLTSVQAGFEIWNLPIRSWLTTNMFSVSPVGFTDAVNRVGSNVDPASDLYVDGDGSIHELPARHPIIGGAGGYMAHAAGCPRGDNARLVITTTRSNTQDHGFTTTVPMTESPANSGNYVSTAAINLSGTTRADGIGSATFLADCRDTGLAWRTQGAIYASDTSDIAWLNQQPSGELSEWQGAPGVPVVGIEKANFLGQGCGGACQAHWKVVGAGDLNGDGRSDLLWFNNDTGQLVEWLIDTTAPAYSVNGNTFLSRTCQACEQAGWRVVGVGDLNGDGFPDVLWHNVNTGVLSQWYLDGLGNVTFGPDIHDSEGDDLICAPDSCSNHQHAVGLADMNQDGHVDIVWRDDSANNFTAWLLDKTGMFKGLMLVHAQCDAPCTYNVLGLGDSNADGHTDVYWYDPVSGTLAESLLDGAGNQIASSFDGSTCGSLDGCGGPNHWKPVAVEDFSPQDF